MLAFQGLFLLVYILLQIPRVQNMLVSKAISFVREKVETEIQLERIDIAFPKSVVLRNLYMEDRSEDTLLYFNRLEVDVDMLALLKKEIQVNHIGFDQLVAKVDRKLPDSSFNFSFIIDAFSDTTAVPKTEEPDNGWSFDIKSIRFERSTLSYNDEVSLLDAHLRIGNLEVGAEVFQPDTLKVYFDQILLENASIKLVMHSASDTSNDPPGDLPDIRFETIEVRGVDFEMESTVEKQDYKFSIGEAMIDANDINLPEKIIALDQLTLSDANADIESNGTTSTTPDSTGTEISLDFGYNISLAQISLNNLAFQLNQDDRTLGINDLNSQMKGLKLDRESIQLNIESLSFEERSGLRLNQLASKINIGSTGADLSDLLIRTDHSTISLDLQSQCIFLPRMFI